MIDLDQNILVELQNQAHLEAESDSSNDEYTILEGLLEDYIGG